MVDRHAMGDRVDPRRQFGARVEVRQAAKHPQECLLCQVLDDVVIARGPPDDGARPSAHAPRPARRRHPHPSAGTAAPVPVRHGPHLAAPAHSWMRRRRAQRVSLACVETICSEPRLMTIAQRTRRLVMDDVTGALLGVLIPSAHDRARHRDRVLGHLLGPPEEAASVSGATAHDRKGDDATARAAGPTEEEDHPGGLPASGHRAALPRHRIRCGGSRRYQCVAAKRAELGGILGVTGAIVGFLGLGYLVYYFIARRNTHDATPAPNAIVSVAGLESLRATLHSLFHFSTFYFSTCSGTMPPQCLLRGSRSRLFSPPSSSAASRG